MFDFLIKALGGYTRADLDMERSRVRSGVQRRAFGMAISAVDLARESELSAIRRSVHFHGVASKAIDSFIDSIAYHLRAGFGVDGYEGGVGFPAVIREQEDGPVRASELSGGTLGAFNVRTRIPDGAISVCEIESGAINVADDASGGTPKTSRPSSSSVGVDPLFPISIEGSRARFSGESGRRIIINEESDPADDVSLPSNVAAVIYKDDLIESVECDGELPANA